MEAMERLELVEEAFEETAQGADLEIELDEGPYIITGVFRVQITDKDTSGTDTTLKIKTSKGRTVATEHYWHGAQRDPTNAGGRFGLRFRVASNERPTLVFGQLAADEVISGFAVTLRPSSEAKAIARRG